MSESNSANKIFVSMQEMMEQLDISDKTLSRMIEEGELPEFSYGSNSKWCRKKGWHVAVLERHAMEKYEQSRRIQNACNSTQVTTEDMAVMPLSRRHTRMAQQGTDLDDRNPAKQQRGSKKMSNRMRTSPTQSRVAAGFHDMLM